MRIDKRILEKVYRTATIELYVKFGIVDSILLLVKMTITYFTYFVNHSTIK